MSKKILVMLYKFPPMGGVATRRWVKLSKVLSKKGVEVHVLCADYHYQDRITWNKDLPDSITIHKYKSRFPSWLMKSHDNKFAYQASRLTKFVLSKLFFDIDEAQYDSYNIVSSAKKIIAEHGISNVLASGHPVSINYFASLIKYDLPSINLIQDFRDNWNDLGVFAYTKGCKRLSTKKKHVFQEALSVNYANHVVNVSNELTNMMKLRHHNAVNTHFQTIYNFYDPDDYHAIIPVQVSDFSLCYFGSLFNGRIEAIYRLLDSIEASDDQFIKDNLRIKLYTNYPKEKIKAQYEPLLETRFKIFPMVGPDQVANLINNAYACLSINSIGSEYAFGTKVFEYFALDKTVFHISNGGELYDVLRESGQIVSKYEKSDILRALLALKAQYSASPTSISVSQTESKFSLESAADSFYRLLK